MKIIRIIPFLDFGGVEQRIRLTAKAFDNVPHVTLIIVVLSQPGKIAKQLIHDGYQVVCINAKVKIPNAKLIQTLTNFLKVQKPDVVHSSGAEANFHGLIAAYLAGVPNRIGEEIGFPNHDWKWRLIFKGLYSLATKVVAISQSVKKRIVDLGEVNGSKVEVVYNPVSNGRSGQLEVSSNKSLLEKSEAKKSFTFITICRLVPIKNLDKLIQAFARIVKDYPQKDLLLRIVGDGTDREKLERLSQNLKIEGKVDFLGFQSDVFPLLEYSDVFVLPSFSEGFSISLVEAMLSELPCIATNQGGPTEILDDGITGFLVDPNDLDQLYQKLNNVLNMPKVERAAIGRRAKVAALNYSPENHITNLLKIYES